MVACHCGGKVGRRRGESLCTPERHVVHFWDDETGKSFPTASEEPITTLSCPESAWALNPERELLYMRWAADKGINPEHYLGFIRRVQGYYPTLLMTTDADRDAAREGL